MTLSRIIWIKDGKYLKSDFMEKIYRKYLSLSLVPIHFQLDFDFELKLKRHFDFTTVED